MASTLRMLKTISPGSCWGFASEQALCLGKGSKNREESEGKRGKPVDKHLRPLFRPLDVIADHLSARSLSVSWIHLNV